MSDRESSLTLQRGLALLRAVADADSGAVTISELAERIGTSRAAIYRLLGPLVEQGLVWRDGASVRLGLGLLRLAERVLPQLRHIAAPALRELAESVGATAHLSVVDGVEMRAIAVVEPSWTSFHVAYRVGSHHAIGVGAAGKAVELSPDGDGWAVSTGELEASASGVAAPVLGVPGLRASVGVVSLEPLAAAVLGPQVVTTAAVVAAALRATGS
ncbi:MAG: helix-turn-helix domain-containing protein [Sciscionella sp.]